MAELVDRVKEVVRGLDLETVETLFTQILKDLKDQSWAIKFAQTTPEFVMTEIMKAMGKDGDFTEFCSSTEGVSQGLRRVGFDFENYEYTSQDFGSYERLMGPRMFGRLPGVGCYGGGDWEFPVFFVIYLDADGRTLRAYVPKDGNAWNYDTNQAFGNHDELDEAFLLEWMTRNNLRRPVGRDLYPSEDAECMVDEHKIVLDIDNQISLI